MPEHYYIEDFEDGTLTSSTGRIDRHPLIAAVAENQRGEVLETAYSHQLTSGGGKPGQGYGAVRVDSTVRRLTPRECERLQGFPDDWTDLGPDTRRYAALGDAVTVPVAEWIGRRLADRERIVSAHPGGGL
jgi:DNA (cytosine-5)-methyltransferase 1